MIQAIRKRLALFSTVGQKTDASEAQNHHGPGGSFRDRAKRHIIEDRADVGPLTRLTGLMASNVRGPAAVVVMFSVTCSKEPRCNGRIHSRKKKYTEITERYLNLFGDVLVNIGKGTGIESESEDPGANEVDPIVLSNIIDPSRSI